MTPEKKEALRKEFVKLTAVDYLPNEHVERELFDWFCDKLSSQSREIEELKLKLHFSDEIEDQLQLRIEQDAKQITDLKAEIERLKGDAYSKAREAWIDCKKRMPEPYKKVFFMTDDIAYPDNVYSGVYYGDDTWGKSGSYPYTKNVTHWMPIPPYQPKE